MQQYNITPLNFITHRINHKPTFVLCFDFHTSRSALSNQRQRKPHGNTMPPSWRPSSRRNMLTRFSRYWTRWSLPSKLLPKHSERLALTAPQLYQNLPALVSCLFYYIKVRPSNSYTISTNPSSNVTVASVVVYPIILAYYYVESYLVTHFVTYV